MKKLSIAKIVIIIFCVCQVCAVISGIILTYEVLKFYLLLALYITTITSGITYMVLYLQKGRSKEKNKLEYSTALFLLCFLGVIVSGQSSVDYIKDFFIGKQTVHTEIYDVAIPDYYLKYPDEPKEICFFDENLFCTLVITEEMYNYLIENNPIDSSRTVLNEPIAETTHPHLHTIEIEYFPNTEIIGEISIIY